MDSTFPLLSPPTATEDGWALVDSLPVSLSVAILVRQFTVRDLLLLEPGTILETADSATESAPLLANGKRIGRGLFEAVGDLIGFKISELGLREQEPPGRAQ
jgi:flagellar motor switch/type III secretory pathway protein FliN